jgi:aminobenzoyl-glutamate transport protein
MNSRLAEKKSIMYRFLGFVEWAGNKLPHPATSFAFFALLVIVISAIFAAMDDTAIHPSTGKQIHPISLLNGDGLIRRIMTTMVTNFTGFVPLVAMLGVGVAEGSGLISALLRALVSGRTRGRALFAALGHRKIVLASDS